MWLRSDKRELRIRNKPKTKFLNNHRKKRKRPNQYSKTIKLMKNEKKLSTSQYSADELAIYKNHNVNNKIFNKTPPSYMDSLAFSSGPISYDLNTLDIDLNIRTSSDAENLAYDSSPDRFQGLDAQYNFNYAKNTSEIHTVADMILKRKKYLN